MLVFKHEKSLVYSYAIRLIMYKKDNFKKFNIKKFIIEYKELIKILWQVIRLVKKLLNFKSLCYNLIYI